MEPRELDALVAENVMGLDLTAHDDETIGAAVMQGMLASHGPRETATVSWNGTEYEVQFAAMFGVGASGNSGHGLHWWQTRYGKPWEKDIEAHIRAWRARPAHYSTEIDTAWTVVDRLRELGWRVTIAECRIVRDKLYDVAFRREGRRVKNAIHEDVARAICLAALKVAA